MFFLCRDFAELSTSVCPYAQQDKPFGTAPYLEGAISEPDIVIRPHNHIARRIVHPAENAALLGTKILNMPQPQ